MSQFREFIRPHSRDGQHQTEDSRSNTHRRYGLGIWALGLGFYLFYTPYSGLTKALSNGLLPGLHGPVKGTVLLPISAIATVAGMLSFITVMGWWKYAGHREFFGISVPFPRRLTFLSGVCMATIMGTTTLAFSFGGLSIVLVLVLLRGGTLIIAPVVDRIVGRRVRWFSWAAMFMSLTAVALVLSDAQHYQVTIAAVIDVAAYLTAYFFKLQFMSRLAKSDEKGATLRYFVEEQMVAAPLLVLVVIAMAIVGTGDVMMEFRFGLTTFLARPDAIFAALAGFFYAALCICTTFIFLDRRENTFCMPMHCGSSLLSGFTATYILAYLFDQNSPSSAQITSAVMVVLALGFLSPLHHFDRSLAKLKNVFAQLGLKSPALVVGAKSSLPGRRVPVARSAAAGLPGRGPAGNSSGKPVRLLLFVCSANTCRSPMAEVIANAELSARLQISFAAVNKNGIHAISAGISASVDAPMTPEAQRALQYLGFPVVPHRARNLTADLAHQVERIYCMTQAHRSAVLAMLPSAAEKTQCLDPDIDVQDPVGSGLDAYLQCARNIHTLVRARFDELDLGYGVQG
ncbi:MAG TPA: hypothetical protein VK582_04325 [Pyrinomonadaceae bacterium]|nr:hypothetical protein [Pyrinomonadaceae bacterium]